MNPTESHKTKSMGKVTSKQRLMEMFEQFEPNHKPKEYTKPHVQKKQSSNVKAKKKSYHLGQTNALCKKAQNSI